MRNFTTIYLIMLAAFMWPGTIAASDGNGNAADLSSSQQAAQEELSALVPDTFYKELTYNPNPLKTQVQLKKPENMDRIKKAKDSREDTVIKRALSLDVPQKRADKKEAGKETAASAGDQSGPGLMDVPLAPGTTFNMGYRYLDYNKVDDSGLSFATPDLPKADYYGKAAEGQEQSAHEISFGVKVDLN